MTPNSRMQTTYDALQRLVGAAQDLRDILQADYPDVYAAISAGDDGDASPQQPGGARVGLNANAALWAALEDARRAMRVALGAEDARVATEA